MSPMVLHSGGTSPASSGTGATTQVVSSADDCYARESSTFSSTTVSNWVGHNSSTAFNYRSMMRFQLSVPQGAEITDATMEQHSNGQVVGGGAVWPLATTIRAHDSDNSSQVVDYTDFTSRESSLTTASVAWSIEGGWNVIEWKTSPDIKSVIQEVVNRAGWTSGNYINVWWGPTDDTYSSEGDIVVQGTAYDDAPAQAAKLSVTYIADAQDANYLAYSEKFDEVGTWVTTDGGGVTLTQDSGDAQSVPSTIQTTAWEVQRDGSFPRLRGALETISAGAYTHSVYAKSGNQNDVTIRVYDAALAAELEIATFNLSTGVVSSESTGGVAAIEDIGGDWFRCSVTATHTQTSNQQMWIIPGSYDATGAGATVYVAGAQSEPGSDVTRYDYTSGTAVT